VIASAAAVPAAAATATGSAALLTKREARRAAVKASADTCRVVEWCRGYRVVPPEHCQRKRRRTVYCPMAFLTTHGHRCDGAVLVMNSRTGRLGVAMAVPFDCGAPGGAGAGAPVGALTGTRHVQHVGGAIAALRRLMRDADPRLTEAGRQDDGAVRRALHPRSDDRRRRGGRA
jgi:hypothetical protein